MFRGLFRKKQDSLSEMEWNNSCESTFHVAVMNEPDMKLKLTQPVNYRTRITAEGTFLGGQVCLRFDKGLSNYEMLSYFEEMKDTMLYFMNTVKREFPDKEVTFVRFENNSDYSTSIHFLINGLSKEITYRPTKINFSLENEFNRFVRREQNYPDIVGTFLIGEERLEEILKENKGRHIEISISGKQMRKE